MLYSCRFLVLCWLSFTSIAQSSVLDDRQYTPTRLMRTTKAEFEPREHTKMTPAGQRMAAMAEAKVAFQVGDEVTIGGDDHACIIMDLGNNRWAVDYKDGDTSYEEHNADDMAETTLNTKSCESTCLWITGAECNGLVTGSGATLKEATKDGCIDACRSNEKCACVTWSVEFGECTLNVAATSGNDIHAASYLLTDSLVLKDCPAAAEVDPAVPETTTQTCPQTVVVAGAEALQPVMMGSYTKSDITPGSTHSSRPIYEHADGVHMYFWAANGKWIMSGTGYNNDHGTLWAKDKDGTTNCPTMASGWEVWNGNAWEGEHTITVSTAG